MFPQPDKLRMSKVIIRRPFGELDLCNQLRFEPHTACHLFLGQSPLARTCSSRLASGIVEEPVVAGSEGDRQ